MGDITEASQEKVEEAVEEVGVGNAPGDRTRVFIEDSDDQPEFITDGGVVIQEQYDEWYEIGQGIEVFDPEVGTETVPDDSRPEELMLRYQGKIYEATKSNGSYEVELFGGTHKPKYVPADHKTGELEVLLDEKLGGRKNNPDESVF